MKKINIFLICSFILTLSYAQDYKLNGNFEWATLLVKEWKVVDVVPTYQGGRAINKSWAIGMLGSPLYDNTPVPAFSKPPDGDVNNKKVGVFYNGGTSQTDSWLISPRVDSIEEGDYLCFWFDNSLGGANYNFDVLISTTDDQTTSFKDTILSFKSADVTPISWRFYTFSLAKYIEKNIHVAFRVYYTGNFDGGIQIDNVTVGISSMPNLELVRILSPEIPLQNVTDSVEITAVIKNLGAKVSSFDMFYKKASAHSYDYTGHQKFNREMDPLDTVHVTFSKKEFFKLGTRDTLNLFVVYPNDVDHTNDTINSIVDNVIPGDIPYTNGFEIPDDIAGIKIYNPMRDESTWTDDLNSAAYARKGNGCIRYAGNPNTDADDWLFTKLLHFTQAKTYEISFWYGTTDEFQPQKLHVKWTTEQKFQSQYELWYLFRDDNITNKIPQNNLETRGYLEAVARFDVETPGYYYIAFRCLSPKTTHNIAQLYIDDLSIREAVDVEEPQNIDVMVFPNPANADIQIQANYTINKVDVYNLLGQKVLSQHYNTKYATLQVSDLTEGLYIVKVNTDNGEIVSKVTVSH